ncbi:trypsin-like serine peptidase [Acutalibacter sp. 1XD8-36]|uniref:trypsin-like serine peptidase n=1 Tax=Acutalibacter sp. 1XD8-36 TaxID=2320852 RepID=UPI0014136D43|nr:trypsin-like serine protease [Acutalibacter sp. 1XD8-36]NBJ88812.1 hypothetical protein [Acutalibacter sp. 1XD8-36]
MKTHLNKLAAIAICVALVLSLIQMPASASEELELNTIEVSALAGSNGAYHYNLITGEGSYSSPEECVSGSASSVPASRGLQEEQPEPHIIIGSDNRQMVTSLLEREESTCLIGARFKTGVKIGTGWLLDNNYLMTAGHMAYDILGSGDAEHIAVFIGATGGTYKQYRLATEYDVGADYKNNTGELYYGFGMYDDWAIVKLATPVNRTVGMLSRHTVNSASEMKGVYYTQGYPADRNHAMGKTDDEWNKWYMFRTSGTIKADRSRFLSLVATNIDIYKGQSGSPIYCYRSGEGYCAEGIVVSDGDADAGDGDRNFIILLNTWLQDRINWHLQEG